MEPSEDHSMEAYQIFAEVCEFPDWGSVTTFEFNASVEFLMFIGVGMIWYSEASMARAAKLCNSPNAEIIVRAYKARRYSFVGRVNALVTKPFVAAIVTGIVLADMFFYHVSHVSSRLWWIWK